LSRNTRRKTLARRPSASLAALVAVVLSAGTASAHSWYDQRFTAEGERCCGGEECAPLADDDVVETTGGYLIRSLGMTVPFADVQSSPDGRFHACVWWIPSRVVKCFFGPPPGS
jgi:hypothetical protein